MDGSQNETPGYTQAEKDQIRNEIAHATPAELNEVRQIEGEYIKIMRDIDRDNQESARNDVAAEMQRRDQLTPVERAQAELRDEEALRAAKGSGLSRDEILAMAAAHRDDDMSGAAPDSRLSPALVKAFDNSRNDLAASRADTAFLMQQLGLKEEKPPQQEENSTIEMRVQGNNLILNITGTPPDHPAEKLPGEEAGKLPTPGEAAGRHSLPGDLAAALDLYKAGHNLNGGGALMGGGHIKFTGDGQDHSDPFKLPSATTGQAERPVQKSVTLGG